MTKLERKVKQLEKLVQYKGLNNKELEELAKKSLEKEKLYKAEWIGLTSPEAKRANVLLRSYIDKYYISKFSDIEDLKTLINNEILKQRIQEKIGKNEGIPPKYAIDSLNTLQNQILTLKEKLGISDDKKQTDAFIYIQKLKKKFKKWMEENQASRSLICPHCSKMIMLKMKMDAWEAQKHPYFVDKFLANVPLFSRYQEGKLTKEEVAEILGCGVDYVDSVIEKLNLNK